MVVYRSAYVYLAQLRVGNINSGVSYRTFQETQTKRGDPMHINTNCTLPPGSLHAPEHGVVLVRELLMCINAGYETLHETRTHVRSSRVPNGDSARIAQMKRNTKQKHIQCNSTLTSTDYGVLWKTECSTQLCSRSRRYRLPQHSSATLPLMIYVLLHCTLYSHSPARLVLHPSRRRVTHCKNDALRASSPESACSRSRRHIYLPALNQCGSD